jgi:hypothetical protein
MLKLTTMRHEDREGVRIRFVFAAFLFVIARFLFVFTRSGFVFTSFRNGTVVQTAKVLRVRW